MKRHLPINNARPLTSAEWKVEILQALELQRKGEVDLDGDTPFMKLMEQIAHLPPSEMDNVRGAILSILQDDRAPREEGEASDYWRCLTLLTRSINENNKIYEMGIIYLKKLFRENHPPKVRLFLLDGLISTGYKLTPAELNMLSDIRVNYPLRWIDAAVASTNFNFAREKLSELILKADLDASGLALFLDRWREKWNGNDSFSTVVHGWMAEAECVDKKEIYNELEEWLEDNGMLRRPAKNLEEIGPPVREVAKNVILLNKKAA